MLAGIWQVKCNAVLLLTLTFSLLLSLAGNVYLGYVLSKSNIPGLNCDACHCSEDAQDDPHSLTWTEEPVYPTLTLPRSRALLEDRFLASSEASSSEAGSASKPAGTSSSSSGTHHGNHPHDALIFFFNAVLIGTAVLHLSSMYPKLQLTVVLFILGVVISLVLEGLDFKSRIDIFGESYLMWMDIDPHLLLFTMLPTLLAGDAMSIDTSVAKRVFFQCLYLAGPGVIVSAMVVAGFLCLYLDWGFLLSLTVGAILCATDPVAVVALLKELSASPLLTTQIQGESLLNDGTAIVLYTVAYEMLCGKSYDVNDMAIFMVKTALMAVALGVFLGYVFFSWVRAAGNRFNHHSSVIQILLTLCAAYWSFIMAEGVLKMSGVLACVGSSIVLAHHMWPHIVNQHTVQHFWHTLEDLGNIIIFILGGALTGAAMVNIKIADYFHLLVIYSFLVLVRGTLIFASRPILQFLNQDKLPVSAADASVMTWGGLRGAVGLALAIQVQRGRAPNSDGVPQIDAYTADRALFFVAGVAFLTTTVNATTTPHLVKWLGITAMPRAQQALLQRFNDELVQLSLGQEHPKEVTDALRRMVAHIEHEVNKSAAKTMMKIPDIPEMVGSGILGIGGGAVNAVMKRSDKIIDAYTGALMIYQSIPEIDKKRLDENPDSQRGQFGAEAMQHICEWMKKQEAEEELCKGVIKKFMCMVQHNYYTQIEHGDLRPGSPETDILLTSVRVCLSPLTSELVDFEFVLDSVRMKDDFGEIEEHHKLPEHMKQTYKRIGKSRKYERLESTRMSCANSLTHNKDKSECQKKLDAMLLSAEFRWTMFIMIVMNTIYVVVEEAVRNPSNDQNYVWLVFEVFFTLAFLIEAIMKLLDKGMAYFHSSWNCFDFMLVVLGIFGIVMNVVAINAASGAAQGSAESRVIRISRVLRTMRLMRIFRLFHARLSLDKFVSDQLALCMHQMQTLMCFVQAHEIAQEDLVKYFSGSLPKCYTDMEAALARCILQSQASVLKALICIVQVQRMMEAKLLDEFRLTKKRKSILEELEQFVEKAQQVGAITDKEAEAILHPMHEEISSCLQVIAKRTDGVITKDVGTLFFEEMQAATLGKDATRLQAPVECEYATESVHFDLIGHRSTGPGQGRTYSNASLDSSMSSPGNNFGEGVPDHPSQRQSEDDPSRSLLRGVPKASFRPVRVGQPAIGPVTDQDASGALAGAAPGVAAPQSVPATSMTTANSPGDAGDSALARQVSDEQPPTPEINQLDSEANASPGGRKMVKKKKKPRAVSGQPASTPENGVPVSVPEKDEA